MLRIAILVALFLSFSACSRVASNTGEKLDQSFSASRVIDLTHPLSEQSPVWPGGIPFRKKRIVDYDKGYRMHSFHLQENVGTHLDAPAHFWKSGTSVEALSLTSLVAPAVVIDVQEQVRANHDYQLSVSDIRSWEKNNGEIPRGSLVILNTGWHRRIKSLKSYMNMDESRTMHFPGYSAEASKLLVQRGVVGIGIDTMSLDHGASKDFGTHQVMLKANKYQLENLANLDALPATGATVVVGVIPVSEGTQAQARVLAFLE